MIEASQTALKWLAERLDGLDKWVKRFGTLAAVVLVLSVIVPPIGKLLNWVSAWRFGANGIIKYELGSDKNGERVPTPIGQLRLLRNGQREFVDIEHGDIVQAISEIRFHEYNDCVGGKKCSTAPVVFELQKGDCAIVLGRAYEDNATEDIPVRNENKEVVDTIKNRKGGWLHVATTACGLFK